MTTVRAESVDVFSKDLSVVSDADRKVPSAILVVEDELEILAPLSHALKRAGYVVFEAADGLTACRMIGSHHPDLILLDIMLPDLDGWEVCRMLRQHPDPHIAATPVIMLTALNTPENKLLGLQLGADAYLPKPYSQQEVLLLSGKLIERHRRQLALEQQVVALSNTVEQQQGLQQLLFHELRNQLSILHGYTELLRDESQGSKDTCLTAIHRSSSYLQSLAENFLLIRKLKDCQLQLPAEPLLVHELASEIVTLYSPVAEKRNVSVAWRVEGQPNVILANRPALKIIISSLLDNALKYGPADSTVNLVCEYGEKYFALTVCDAGQGVAPEERTRIFQQFYRGNDRVGGSGLGLYGVRVLSQALGGDAEIDEGCDCGFCLRIWLPLLPQAKQAAP
jgi:two-component system, sensor histidine kinase and response regulator